jgi:RHS repeat-associated protein
MEYPGHTVARVDGLMVLGGDVYLDDIVFSGGRLRRSRQVVPGAALGGVLGSWTGPNVVAENGVAARYFHYNDLGTVLAQTKSDGTLEGAWEPDHFGNYEGRYAYTGSPARPELGLTGKIYDDAVGAYYSWARWLDPERGRWISQDPTGFMGGINLYCFVGNIPTTLVDLNGLIGISHLFEGRKNVDLAKCRRDFADCMAEAKNTFLASREFLRKVKGASLRSIEERLNFNLNICRMMYPQETIMRFACMEHYRGLAGLQEKGVNIAHIIAVGGERSRLRSKEEKCWTDWNICIGMSWGDMINSGLTHPNPRGHCPSEFRYNPNDGTSDD